MVCGFFLPPQSCIARIFTAPDRRSTLMGLSVTESSVESDKARRQVLSLCDSKLHGSCKTNNERFIATKTYVDVLYHQPL